MASTADSLNSKVYDYFQTPRRVVVAETFAPGAGWKVWNRYRKTVTASWVRKLRQEGVTVVALTDGRRVADFRIAELLSTRNL
jgi:hypothetical protein